MKNWKKCTLSEIWEKCTLFRYFFFIVYCTFGVTSAYDFWWHEHLWLVASRSIHRVITQQALVSDIRLSYARCPPSLAHTNLWSIGLIRSGDLEMIGWLSETTGQKLSGSWQRGRGTKQHFFFFFSSICLNRSSVSGSTLSSTWIWSAVSSSMMRTSSSDSCSLLETNEASVSLLKSE